jgi:PAS domain S-box-containing protein
MVFLLIRQYTLQRREAEAQIERRQTEKTLRESEKRFRELSDSLPQVVFETDEKGNLTFANKNAFDVFGYTRDDFDKGINVLQTLVPMDHNRALENIQSVMSGKILGTLEYTALKKDGSTFPVAIHSNPIFRDNKTVGLRGILIDLTEKKKLEAQLQQAHKMESIGTLAGGIAHDFNNIIGIIVGNTELAIDDVPEWNPARQNLEEIRTASLRARDVVKQILAFSRQSAQELKPVRIGPIIIESLQLVRSSIPTTIQIHQDISAESDTVRADPTQINQILINLCTNAAHSMRDKGGILEVNLENVTINKNASTTYHDIPLGEYVRLTIKDTGRGIDAENLKRIFDPYFTTKKVGEGSGMGLAVVHGIVKSHFGNIAVRSTEGKGTTFHVLLPCTEDRPDKETHVSAKIPRGNDRILLVDDEKAMVDAIKLMLERLGYQVAARTSSIEALEAFRANSDKYDLVITDYTMPNMTGIELTKKLLRLRPDIPIILCTGFSEQINEEKAKEKGIRAFLMKPIVMHEMANSIRKALNQDR